jgi:hypothetical protein
MQPTAKPTETPAVSRRAFFDRITKLGVGSGVAAMLSGFRAGGTDRQMHGPVRPATELLRAPAAPDAMALLSPYTDGRPFAGRWAVGYAARGERGEIGLVLVDTETGGHAELYLFRRARGATGAAPAATSRRYAVHFRGTSDDEARRPRHLVRLAERIADIVWKNERRVTLVAEPPVFDVRPGQ